MLETMTPDDRLRLMKFVCTFAWADLEVQEEEREFIGRLILALRIPPREAARVLEWLEVPPDPEEVDPQDVPREHRQIFLEAMKAVVERDGRVAPSERESFQLLEQLLR